MSKLYHFQITIETIEKAASQAHVVHHQEVAEIEVTEEEADPVAIEEIDVQVDTNAEGVIEGGAGGAILIITTKTELMATVICLRARRLRQHPLPRLLTCLLRLP